MKTKQNEPVLQFMDDEHQVRFEVKLENDWPILTMSSGDDQTEIQFGMVDGKPSLFFNDGKGAMRMGIALSKPDGAPRLVILDQHEQPRFALVQDTDGTPRVIATDQVGGKYKLMWFAAQKPPASNPD